MTEALKKEAIQRVQVEIVKVRPEFTKHEISVLEGDGARVLRLFPDETLEFQMKIGRPFLWITKAEENVEFLKLKPRAMDVAVYPTLEKFFVKDSFNERTIKQKELLRIDAENLRERLGLPNIGEILPEVSEATQAIFNYWDRTGIRILGKGYRMLYIRTGTFTDKSGSLGALVGEWCDAAGDC